MKARITNKLLKSIKPRKKPFEIRDIESRGFILRVQPSGATNYYAEYRLPDGRRNRIKLNRNTHLLPAQARDEALKVFEKVRQGIDPKAEQVAKGHTLRSFMDDIYEPWMVAEYKTGAGQVSRIRASCKPRLPIWTRRRPEPMRLKQCS